MSSKRKEREEESVVEPELSFISRRSCVLSTRAAAASSQPLATRIGLSILEKGGNAVDACVAMAAALALTEPASTGAGGDCFCIFYNAATGKVSGLNGSGRAPANLSIDTLKLSSDSKFPHLSAHAVTVPGAVAGWCDVIEKWGTMEISTLLQPSIDLATEGFPVHQVSAHGWGAPDAMKKLTAPGNEGGQELLVDGKPPKQGDIVKNPGLAEVFHLIGKLGKAGFYQGKVAQAIVDVVQKNGGVLSLEDLAEHTSTFPDPISVNYNGIDVWEIPPNGQGITALLALNILEACPPAARDISNGALHVHYCIEALRLAFADTRWYVADPDHVKVPVKELLSKEYAKQRASLINPEKATLDFKKGSPVVGSDTVSFCAVDRYGNACSFINSTYMGFGSGLVPRGCGFTLQNRGANFSLDPNHPNALAPRKRPYHTIIPGMATKNGKLFCPFSVMGGFNQPQGHLQVLTRVIDGGMDPQKALDLPRFCIASGESNGAVCVEENFPPHILAGLKRRGHELVVVDGYAKDVVGRGQMILRAPNGVLWAGSDGRGDGCAAGL